MQSGVSLWRKWDEWGQAPLVEFGQGEVLAGRTYWIRAWREHEELAGDGTDLPCSLWTHELFLEADVYEVNKA